MTWLLLGCFEQPNINVVPTRFDFGTVLVGELAEEQLQMHNIGTGTLEVEGFLLPTDFRIEPETMVLGEDESGWFTVIFEPQAPAVIEEEMSILSNDVDGEIRLSINATASVD